MGNVPGQKISAAQRESMPKLQIGEISGLAPVSRKAVPKLSSGGLGTLVLNGPNRELYLLGLQLRHCGAGLV